MTKIILSKKEKGKKKKGQKQNFRNENDIHLNLKD